MIAPRIRSFAPITLACEAAEASKKVLRSMIHYSVAHYCIRVVSRVYFFTMRALVGLCTAITIFGAEPLPNTRPLTIYRDPATQMIADITTYLIRATGESVTQRKPTR